jgi:putative PIN family toxin of toxin-antitoxin system
VTRVVLDTMVLASGFTSDAGASARLLQRWQNGEFTLVVSEHILQELERTLNEDHYFAARTTPSRVAPNIALLRAAAIVTPMTVPVVGVATHPEDDVVLSTALSGQVSILCTRDKQLLKLHSYQTVAILSPGELLALLEDEGLA